MKVSGFQRVQKCQFNLLSGPSDEWFAKFQARHPELTWKIPQSIDSTQITQATDYIVDNFFNKYGKNFIELLYVCHKNFIVFI